MDNSTEQTVIVISDDEDSFESSKSLSKKRKIDEISQNIVINLEEESNSLLRLKKLKKEDDDEVTIIEKPVKSSDKVLLNFYNKNTLETDNTKINPTKQEEIKQEPNIGQNRPIMWINRLKYYPSDRLTKNMISFDQLISEDLSGSMDSKRKMQVAFMTCFGYTVDLLERVIELGVKFTLADNWKSNSEPKIVKNYLGYKNLTLIRPPKDPAQSYQGTFHSKLWLLKFPNFLRVVVTTGNMMGDHATGFSNSYWFRDFPKISTLAQIPAIKQLAKGEFDYDKDFVETLTSFVQAIMPVKTHYTNLIDINIHDYFISGIDIVLIPSIPGKHTGSDIDKYGHRRVCSVLKKIVPKESESFKNKKHIMTYQTSSVGNLNQDWLQEMLSSFIPNYMSLNELKSQPKKLSPDANNAGQPSSQVRLIFPTKHYVETCYEGAASGSLCLMLNHKDYKRPTFPKDIFYRYQAPQGFSFHEGAIPHLKTVIVTKEDEDIDDDSIIYFGSHNFSAVAWGKYDSNFTRFTISNTELGILVPPAKGSKEKKQEIIKGLSFRFPPQKYKPHQVPWTAKFIPW